MKFPTIRKKTMRGVSGSEDVLAEEGLEARGRMIWKLERLTGAHQKVASELLSHPGKVGSVAEQFCIRKEEVLIECKLKFINIANIRYQFATRWEKVILNII